MATVRAVVQSVDSAELLVDNVQRTVAIRTGVVVYICFLKGASDASVDSLVTSLLTTKIFTADRIDPAFSVEVEVNRPKPVAISECKCDLLVIPQATLAGKPKGKLEQYHSLVEKDEGFRLYCSFCQKLRAALVTGAATEAYDPNGVPRVGAAEDRRVYNGTYGNRQGLKFEASGPFTHLIEI